MIFDWRNGQCPYHGQAYDAETGEEVLGLRYYRTTDHVLIRFKPFNPSDPSQKGPWEMNWVTGEFEEIHEIRKLHFVWWNQPQEPCGNCKDWGKSVEQHEHPGMVLISCPECWRKTKPKNLRPVEPGTLLNENYNILKKVFMPDSEADQPYIVGKENQGSDPIKINIPEEQIQEIKNSTNFITKALPLPLERSEFTLDLPKLKDEMKKFMELKKRYYQQFTKQQFIKSGNPAALEFYEVNVQQDTTKLKPPLKKPTNLEPRQITAPSMEIRCDPLRTEVNRINSDQIEILHYPHEVAIKFQDGGQINFIIHSITPFKSVVLYVSEEFDTEKYERYLRQYPETLVFPIVIKNPW